MIERYKEYPEDDLPRDGHPVQIMYFDREAEETSPAGQTEGSPSSTRERRPQLIFRRELAEQILGGNRKRPVAVISVVGATKQGKSFWLGYLLRYLRALETKFQGDWMTLPLRGFPFGRCEKTRTQGIWMWSRPFRLVTDDGTELDVLVLDTQGIFDRAYSDTEYCITVGLSLLVSSCFIFNVKDNINEEVLQLLNKFLTFGRMAKDVLQFSGEKIGDQVEKPFQKLLFLVRDWNDPMTFDYGSAGGLQFIQDVLSQRSQDDPASRIVRQEIGNSFHDKQCSLLPHPGQHFLRQQTPEAQNQDHALDPEFKEKLRESVETVLTLENREVKDLPLCLINGEPLTAPDVIAAMEIAVDQFNSHEIPTPDSTYEVTSKFIRATVVNRILGQYKDVMGVDQENSSFYLDDHLRRRHNNARDLALKSVESKARRIISDHETLQDLERGVSREIEEIFLTLKQKNELLRFRSLSNAHKKSRESFHELMTTKFQEIDFLSPVTFQSLADKAGLLAQECFQNLFSFYEGSDEGQHSYPPEFQAELQNLQDFIDTETEKYDRVNKDNKLKAEDDMKREVEKMIQAYKQKLETELGGNYYPEMDFREFGCNLEASTVFDFLSRKTRSNDELVLQAKSDFCVGAKEVFKQIEMEAKNLREQHDQNLLSKYRELMTLETRDRYVSDNDLFAKDIKLKTEVFEQFQTQDLKHPEKFEYLLSKSHFDHVRGQMLDFLEHLTFEIHETNEQFSIPITKAAEVKVREYEQVMEENLRNMFYPEKRDFQDLHQTTLEMVVASFYRTNMEAHPELLAKTQEMLRTGIKAAYLTKIKAGAKNLRIKRRESMVEKYRELMTFEIDERFMGDLDLLQMHELVKTKVFEDFRHTAVRVQEFDPGRLDAIFASAEFLQINTQIEGAFQSLKPTVERTNLEIEARMQEVISRSVTQVFEENMRQLEDCADGLEFDRQIEERARICEERLEERLSSSPSPVFDLDRHPSLRPRIRAWLDKQIARMRRKIVERRVQSSRLWRRALLGGLATGGVALGVLGAIICPLAIPVVGMAVASSVGTAIGVEVGVITAGAVVGAAAGAAGGGALGVATGAVVAGVMDGAPNNNGRNNRNNLESDSEPSETDPLAPVFYHDAD